VQPACGGAQTTILDGVESEAGKGSTVTHDRAGDGIGSHYEIAFAVGGEKPHAEDAGDRPAAPGLDAEALAALVTVNATKAARTDLVALRHPGQAAAGSGAGAAAG
jgi:beta-glucosidase